MQPTLTAKVIAGEKEVGRLEKVIMDPLSHEISHLVVKELGALVLFGKFLFRKFRLFRMKKKFKCDFQRMGLSVSRYWSVTSL